MATDKKQPPKSDEEQPPKPVRREIRRDRNDEDMWDYIENSRMAEEDEDESSTKEK